MRARVLRGSSGSCAIGVGEFEGAVGGGGAMVGEGAVGGDFDVEVEQPVDAPLVPGGGVGEAGAGVGGKGEGILSWLRCVPGGGFASRRGGLAAARIC